MSNTNVYSKKWNDQIFEGRNKNYGAYVLRRQADDNTIKGLLTGVAILALAVIVPFVIRTFFSTTIVKDPITLTTVNLMDKPLFEIEKIIVPAASPKTPKSATDMMVKPLIVNDAKVIDTDDKTTSDLQSKNDVTSGNENPDSGTGGDLGGGGGMNVIPEDTNIYNIASIEQSPEFPGGEEALLQYIGYHTNYPRDMIESNIQGTVYLSFIVDKSGQVKNVDVMRGISASKKFEKEAVRVLNTLPTWKPGKQNGHTVNVMYMIPVKFILR